MQFKFILWVILLLLGTMTGMSRADVTVTLVSTDALGVQGNAVSRNSSISADGQLVAFVSSADNLVPDDTNNDLDVFVKNVVTGQIFRVNESAGGEQANEGSNGIISIPSISADGRFVAFESFATNLVADADTNDARDVFVKNLETGEIIRASEDADGVQGDSDSIWPSISADGLFVAFNSDAINLVPNADTNDEIDVFVKNLETGEILRASEDAGGVQGNLGSILPRINADGHFVAFTSGANNLVPEPDTNGRQNDVFVKNMETGEVVRVSENAGGQQSNRFSFGPSISADGSFVAFESGATNLVADADTNDQIDVFVKNVETEEIIRVSENAEGVLGISNSTRPSISADGHFVAFESIANNLVPGDRCTVDVYVKNVQTGEIVRVSEGPMGTQASHSTNDGNLNSSISADGRFIAFGSDSINLVADDMNATEDIFLAEIIWPSESTFRLNLRHAVYTDALAEVFWDRFIGNSNVLYEITRNDELFGVLDALSVFHEDLQPNVQYTYTVNVIDNQGNRLATDTTSFTTNCIELPRDSEQGNPQAPENVTFAIYSGTAAEVFWDRASDDGLVIGYEVIRNDVSRGILDVLSVFDDDLTPGEEYIYKISSIDNEGNRSTTSTIRLTSGGPDRSRDAPAPPTGLSALLYSSTAAELFWDRASVPGLRYEIERDGAVLAINDGTSHFDDTLLPNVQVFEYSVVTIDSDDRRSSAASITLGRLRKH